MLSFTSICACAHANYQVDFMGKIEHDAISKFEKWCIENEVIWGHLFYEENGNPVKSYNGKDGLINFAA